MPGNAKQLIVARLGLEFGKRDTRLDGGHDRNLQLHGKTRREPQRENVLDARQIDRGRCDDGHYVIQLLPVQGVLVTQP